MSKTETAHINPYGFREYDARWLYPKDINQEGIKNVGRGLGYTNNLLKQINRQE